MPARTEFPVDAAPGAERPNEMVVACSALRRAYRDAIRVMAPSTAFVLLNVDTAVLQDRLTLRPGHFMPASLLTSELETLEPLEPPPLLFQRSEFGPVQGGGEAVGVRYALDGSAHHLTVTSYTYEALPADEQATAVAWGISRSPN